jgi:hypothetical protein
MDYFECGYAGANKDSIRMSADLDVGWRNLKKGWGFYAEDYLDYKDESKFHCKLYLVEKAPKQFDSRKTFHERYFDSVKLGNSIVSLHGVKLEVCVPLSQEWKPTNDSNRRPSIYEIGEDIFYLETSD